MELIQKTSNQLTIKYYPSIKWLVGNFLYICAVASLFGAQSSTLDCKRNALLSTQGECTLANHYILPIESKRTWQIEQVKGANLLPQGKYKDGRISSYKIYLITAQEQVETPFETSNISDGQEIVKQIQDFLGDSQQPGFKEQIDHPVVWFSMVLFVFGWLLKFSAPAVWIHLDKETKKLSWEKYYSLGTKKFEYRINQIADVFVQKQFGSPRYRLVIVLKEGKQIAVHPYEYLPNSSIYTLEKQIKDLLRSPVSSKKLPKPKLES